jgi:Flp pilus assembly protein TadB
VRRPAGKFGFVRLPKANLRNQGAATRAPGKQLLITMVGIYAIAFVVAVIGISAGAAPIVVAVLVGVAVGLFVLVPPLRSYRRRIRGRTPSKT